MLIDEIPRNWRNALSDFIETERGKNILQELDTLLKGDRGNYNPRRKNIFAAFKKTPFKKVRVVIIGQNPYAERLDATGLAFATDRKTTASLDNIYTAIRRNGFVGERPANGSLNYWARQNILLLNSVLTFRKDDNGGNAHKGEGWEEFIQAVVKALVDSERHIHFMLWGTEAHKFEILNCPKCHFYKPYLPAQQQQDYVEVFLNSRQFFDVNDEIRRSGRKGELPINWFLPE